MNISELLLIAVALSMDAFAVAVCTGLALRKATWGKSLIVGLYFGLFQALMPFAGYMLAMRFADKIAAFDHWIAFALLGVIGGKMIAGNLKKDTSADKERSGSPQASLKPARMLPLALATSIDAMAIGVSFAFLRVGIIRAVGVIGITTLVLSAFGVKIGNAIGPRLQSKAELAGGVILILMGLKILLEHLGVITL